MTNIVITKNATEWHDRMAAHIAADELIQGKYWDDGKGCFIGCSVHSSDAMKMQAWLGMPVMVIKLAEQIFEGLPIDRAKQFTRRISDPGLIYPGMDLSLVGWKFQHWLLTDEKVNPGIIHPLVRDAVFKVANEVILPLSQGKSVDENLIGAARRAARSAARSADSAAKSAVWSADSAVWSARSAARSADSAAKSAVWSAECAVWSARGAVWSADSAHSAHSAESADSAVWSARSAARSAESAAYQLMADRLIELIGECR